MKLLVALLLSLPLASLAHAQTTMTNNGMRLAAKEVHHNGDVIRATGGVTIAIDNVLIRADEAELNTASGPMQLRGNVQLQTNPADSVRQAILAADDAFRVAKLANDVQKLDALLHPVFIETNQNGNSRDKVAFIDLFRTFEIGSMTTTRADVRVSGATAVVTGTQVEDGTQMLFMRTYVLENGTWILASSMQYRTEAQRLMTVVKPPQ